MKHTIAILATIALLVGMANADGLDGARSQLSSLIESSQNSFSGSSFDRTSSNLGLISSTGTDTRSQLSLDDLKARIHKDFSVLLSDDSTPIDKIHSNLDVLVSSSDSGNEYSGGRINIESNLNTLTTHNGIPAVGTPYYHAELVNMLK